MRPLGIRPSIADHGSIHRPSRPRRHLFRERSAWLPVRLRSLLVSSQVFYDCYGSVGSHVSFNHAYSCLVSQKANMSDVGIIPALDIDPVRNAAEDRPCGFRYAGLDAIELAHAAFICDRTDNSISFGPIL